MKTQIKRINPNPKVIQIGETTHQNPHFMILKILRNPKTIVRITIKDGKTHPKSAGSSAFLNSPIISQNF